MPLRGVHVLLVEDHADSREVGEAMLTYLGARVDVAEDAEQGLEKLRQGCPDLVLCDLAMPGMDGYEFARRVRRTPACAHARLVALTAFHGDGPHLRAWSAGFDAYLEKPISSEKLNEIAERFMLGPSSSETAK